MICSCTGGDEWRNEYTPTRIGNRGGGCAHHGAPCKSTYCTYDGAHTEVFMKTRDDFGNILKNHERWHCEHTTGMKCMCTCAKQLPCRLRHHHKKTGYTKDFKLCKPQA